MLENARQIKNSPIFLEIFLNLENIFTFFWKITIKNYSFFELCASWRTSYDSDGTQTKTVTKTYEDGTEIKEVFINGVKQ